MGYRYKKHSIYIWIFVISFGFSHSLSAYEVPEAITVDFINESKSITQGDLAIILVRSAGLESELPTAPIKENYITLLDSKGIRPLTGWDRNRMLTTGDFAAILVHALGLDIKLVSAQEACDRAIEHIQNVWELQYRLDGYRKNLDDLLQDKRFFPRGPPESPLGHKYVDRDKNYAVDPVAILPGKEELQPAVRYIYALEKRGIILEGSPVDVVTLKSVKAALRSPVFRSAPGNVYAEGFEEEVKEKAKEHVTPITPGGP